MFCPSGPPKVAFSWRHWAHWTGPYKGRAPTGELLEMYGMAVAVVDEAARAESRAEQIAELRETDQLLES